MIQSGSFSKPSIAIPESQKNNQDYYERWARSIVQGSLTDSYANSYSLMAELYKFYASGSSGDLTQFIQHAADGSDLPAYWTTTNTIKTKVDLLVGEMEERGYEIRAIAMNKEAISRKLEEKERLRVERKLQPLFQQMGQQTGLPLQGEEYIPQSDQELDEYMDLSFKDKAEIIIEGALKWLAKRNDWDEHRKKMFMDVIIVNKAIARSEVYRGIPTTKRIDPLCFIFDPDSTDDMLSDSTYFGEVYYMPLAEAAEKYGLSIKELESVYASYENYLGLGQIAAQSTGTNENAGFGSLGTNRFKWFKKIDNSPRVLVIRTCWKDIKDLNYKYEKKDKGEGEVEFLQKTDKPKEATIAKQLECWRQCTIIGGQIIKEWGEVPNQPRSLEDLGRTECPYKVWVPNYYQSHSVSKVEQLVGLQLFKDILMYNMQVQVSTAGGKGVEYDLAMLPEGLTKEQAMGYLKTTGILFKNSKEYQMGSNAPAITNFDLGLGNSLNGILELMQYVDNEMNNISGVSPERQGIVQASTAVGVNQAALLQSNLITAPYFKGFERFCSRIHNYQAKLVKIAWAGNEVFAPIIGDVGIDFLKNTVDLELDDFDCWIASLPPLVLDRQKLENLVQVGLQSQQVTLEDALSILMEVDTKIAIRKFQRKMALRKMLEAKQQQAQAQQEQQMAQQEQEAQAQNQQMMTQSQAQLQEMKNQANLQKTAMSGRVKLNEKKLDLLNQ